ncbi:centrosomal protein 20 [Aplysia californica]|uniref:Centrosomal protein 20 n=1 Tax=Aplysia californica TaxID=6500 RepID=A0ABM0JAK6_APLCA|nr:centrosomal protein 20 [Aplysia californica]
MASSQDLKEVLKESLENKGSLGEIKARIRAEVFRALDDQSEAKPHISNENVLIFELIREFLEYNHCKYSVSVLVSETGLPKVPLDRDFLRNELNVVEDAPSKSVPLLYSLVSNYKDDNADRALKAKGFFNHAGTRAPSTSNMKDDTDHEDPAPVIVKGSHL